MLLCEQEAEQRAAQVTGQLTDARKVWDAERAALQGRLAEAEEHRSGQAAREAQACSRASALQLQLQAAESARGGSMNWLTPTTYLHQPGLSWLEPTLYNMCAN